jgi:hypothetical protein
MAGEQSERSKRSRMRLVAADELPTCNVVAPPKPEEGWSLRTYVSAVAGRVQVTGEL